MSRMYFVFDMDETLAELYSMYYFIASLRLRDTWKEHHRSHFPESLEYSLQRAYRMFVRQVLAEEVSDFPLGVLRPGILEVMLELHFLKRKGMLDGVIIYSNNSHLPSLEFIRDLIHTYIGSDDLIKDCIHWHHPMRGEERILQAGFSNKTWSVLHRIMHRGHCQAPSSLEPSQVHFFDDLEHHDLKRVLQQNYHLVPAYQFRASFDRLASIYRDVLEYTNVDVNAMMEYVIPLFTTEDDVMMINMDDEIQSMLEFYRDKTKRTANENQLPPLWDSGVQMMMYVIERVFRKNESKGIPPKRNDRKRKGNNRRNRTNRRKHHRRWSSQRNQKRQRSS
jgi:hypothetical protein